MVAKKNLSEENLIKLINENAEIYKFIENKNIKKEFCFKQINEYYYMKFKYFLLFSFYYLTVVVYSPMYSSTNKTNFYLKEINLKEMNSLLKN